MIRVLAHTGLAALTLVAWFGLGSLALAWIPPVRDRLLHVLNRVGAGAIVAALATFAAGWAGVLHAGAFQLAFVVTIGLGLAAAASSARHVSLPRLTSWRPWELALGAVIALYVVFAVVAVSAPISSPDALLYHAADPAQFEAAGRIIEIPWNSSSYEPFTVEMLVLDGLLVWDPVQGAFSPLLLGLLAAAAVMGAASRIAGRPGALLAGAIFFAQPFMLWETTSVFVEPGLAAAIALAAWNVARFVRYGETGALLVAGAFCGGAAGMKYLGLIATLALVVVLVIVARPRLRASHVLAFLVPAAAVAAPWYVKNAILTGNPVYPHLFGGLNSAAADELQRSMEEDFGHGRSILDLALLPARLLTDGDAFDGGEWISPLFLAFAPLALVLAPVRRRWKLAVAAGLLVFVVAWFATTQQARFFLPLMPAAAVLAALGILVLAAQGTLGRVAAAAATASALAAGLAASTVYAAQFAPVAVGAESEHAYLAKKVSLYNGVDWLNRQLGAGDKVAVDFWSLLYLQVPYVTFGTMGDLLPPSADATETQRFVDRYGVTHFAVLEEDADRRRQAERIRARLIARVPVRSVRSRTRGELGPWQDMLVYVVR